MLIETYPADADKSKSKEKTMTEVQSHRSRGERRLVASAIVSLLVTCAIAMAAFAAPAGATPTVFCKAREALCLERHTYAAGKTVEATSKDFKIATKLYEYSCGEATVKFKTNTSSGDPLTTDLTKFSLAKCKAAGLDCIVESTDLTDPTIDWPSNGNGIVDLIGAKWSWTCTDKFGQEFPAGTFDGTALTTTLKGGSPASFSFEKKPLYCYGVCPAEASLTASFTVDSPTPLYVEKGGAVEEELTETALCKAKEEYCASGNVLASGTTVKAGLAKSLTIATSLGDVKCKSSSLEVKTQAAAGNPLPISISSWGNFANCGTNEAMTNCTVNNISSAKGGSLLSNGGANGTLTLGSEAPLQFYVVCEGALGFVQIDCSFSVKSQASLAGGGPATITAKDPLEVVPTEGPCPEEEGNYFEATYEVTSPNPVYVAR